MGRHVRSFARTSRKIKKKKNLACKNASVEEGGDTSLKRGYNPK